MVTKRPIKNTIPKHKVDLELKAADIAKAGSAVQFKVHADGALLGTIEIGQGTFGWKASKKKYFKRTNWTKFADQQNADK